MSTASHTGTAHAIETQAERLSLQALGVEFGQGFLFGRPDALR